MAMNLQPILRDELVSIEPLKENDFDELFFVASDAMIWEQHPNKNRYQEPVFRNFFEGAMQSGGAFLVRDTQTGKTIGSSRFYDLNEEKREVLIGYTFLARSHWGGKYNGALKKIMMQYAFQFVDRVIFHIGSGNIRSQMAMERIGGRKIGEAEIHYHGEPGTLNFIYEIDKAGWSK